MRKTFVPAVGLLLAATPLQSADAWFHGGGWGGFHGGGWSGVHEGAFGGHWGAVGGGGRWASAG